MCIHKGLLHRCVIFERKNVIVVCCICICRIEIWCSLCQYFTDYLFLVLLTVPKEEDYRLPFLNHPQLPAGILPMVPEVAQAVGANQGPHAPEYGRQTVANPAKASLTALIANELLYAGTSLTAENVLKGSNSLALIPHGPLTRPSEQLGYLASVQGLQVELHTSTCTDTQLR